MRGAIHAFASSIHVVAQTSSQRSAASRGPC